jgi:hypothetical protein
VIGHIVTCAREDCENEFPKTTHNMKYCSNNCCRIQTNRKLMKDYHEDKAILAGKKRTCATCRTSLSRYNPNKVCAACSSKKKESEADVASDILASVSWL